jgi:hypothetical protein
MKKTTFKTAIIALTTMVLFSGCEKDKTDDNEEELITSVQLVFTPTGGGTPLSYTFRDLDGDGGNPPSLFQDIVLAPNRTYTVSISLANESVSPIQDITTEVADEGEDHQFYFAPTGANVTVTNLNTDRSGLPLGLTSTWTTGAVSNGNVLITLKHKPGIKAAGDAVTKGETDIELNWVTRIQ